MSWKNATRVLDKDGMILKGGALILHNSKLLLIYRNKWDDWTFPKGHLEKNETIEECMKREVSEETGLEIEIISELPDIVYSYPEGDGVVRIKMFLTKPKNMDLHIENKNDKLVWFSVAEAFEKLSYDNNREFIEKIRSILE